MRDVDVDAVFAIEEVSFPSPWTRTMFISELQREHDRVWLVVEWAGEVIGYGGVMLVDTDVHVMNLAIRPDARRYGIGSALLGGLLAEACKRGAMHATLEVRERNAGAIALYEKAGFHDVGRRPDYYVESGEDAVIMWSDECDAPGMTARLEALLRSGTEALERFESRSGNELVLGIETSCDETAAAVMRGGRELVASVVATQVDFHARFGGVVPEIASRKHTEAIVGVVDEALERAGRELGREAPLAFEELDAVAVTYGPGLVGALVIGVAYGKGLSMATGVPLVGVNHLEGHIFANVLADRDVKPPLVALVVSGGHTSLVHMPAWGEYHTLGETLDDATGEAFDKVAKALGLGYPGGPILSKLAENGDPAAIDFPRAMMRSGDYAFSLSGLKTAVITHIRREEQAGRDINTPDLAASFQQAVIDVQVSKSVRAVEECGVTTFCLAGGVAANSALREALRGALEGRGVHVSVPPLELCTDNAAMIAAAGTYRYRNGERLGLDAEAVPGLRLDTQA